MRGRWRIWWWGIWAQAQKVLEGHWWRSRRGRGHREPNWQRCCRWWWCKGNLPLHYMKRNTRSLSSPGLMSPHTTSVMKQLALTPGQMNECYELGSLWSELRQMLPGPKALSHSPRLADPSGSGTHIKCDLMLIRSLPLSRSSYGRLLTIGNCSAEWW